MALTMPTRAELVEMAKLGLLFAYGSLVAFPWICIGLLVEHLGGGERVTQAAVRSMDGLAGWLFPPEE